MRGLRAEELTKKECEKLFFMGGYIFKSYADNRQYKYITKSIVFNVIL